jgi:hypothetical protein
MANQRNKGFTQPDERREFKGNGHLDLIRLANDVTIGRGEFAPGWRWSNDVKPIAETELCEAGHSGYCLEGSMTIRMKDGETFTIRAGEAFSFPAGHDAWVEGNERCVLVDFGGYKDYAKEKEKAA